MTTTIQFKTFNFKKESSFGMGGQTSTFVPCSSDQEVLELFQYLKKNKRNYFVLGGCCNIIPPDAPSDTVYIRFTNCDLTIDQESVTVGAGYDFDELCLVTTKQGLQGLEHLSGIPGHAGASPIQNIGAYNHEIGEVLTAVYAFDLKEERFVTLSKEECRFSYRSSRFNSSDQNRFWILKVTLALRPNQKVTVTHAEILNELDSGEATPYQVRQAVMKVRHQKGMLKGEQYPKSAGSFFKNPVISKVHYEKIVLHLNEKVPCYEISGDANNLKVPAAYLIGKAGFSKGLCYKGVGISPLHNLSLINVNEGSAQELLELANLIIKGVFEKFEVELSMEPIVVR